MRHYLENAEADANSYFFMNCTGDSANLNNRRYFLTGDVGVLDQDGYLYLKGRAKELIKKGGEQVSPYEVRKMHPLF
jgi:acyl-CoA synthetase (AMP-forming)/AMP-acid ligase II